LSRVHLSTLSVVLSSAVLLCGTTRTAYADWLYTPFIGAIFAGTTVLPDLEQGAGSTQTVFGGSAGWLSSGVVGIEAEFSYAPRFFERTSGGLVTDSNLATAGVDLMIAAPLSVTRESLRPYLVGGVGWMHAAIEEGANIFPEIFGRARNSANVNLGGGAIGLVTPRTGVRFDLRHFRSLERDTNPLTGGPAGVLAVHRRCRDPALTAGTTPTWCATLEICYGRLVPSASRSRSS
jgi:hypothetical protein